MNNTLLPPSASAWMRSAEAATAKLSGITVAIRTLWTPTVCPVDLLPYLAWALSVDRWDKNWPAEKKISAIQQSCWLHQRKGTRAGVRRAIEDMGFSALFIEWFDVGEEPGTFSLEVDVNETGLTGRSLTELERVVEGTKPVSRHISSFTISTRTDGPFYLGAALLPGDILTVYPQEHTAAENLRYLGITHFDGNYHFSGDDDD